MSRLLAFSRDDRTTDDFIESVRALASFAQQHLILFLSCPAAIRRNRLRSNSEKVDFDVLLEHETECAIDTMESHADAIIDTSGTLSGSFKQVSQALRRAKMI